MAVLWFLKDVAGVNIPNWVNPALALLFLIIAAFMEWRSQKDRIGQISEELKSYKCQDLFSVDNEKTRVKGNRATRLVSFRFAFKNFGNSTATAFNCISSCCDPENRNSAVLMHSHLPEIEAQNLPGTHFIIPIDFQAPPAMKTVVFRFTFSYLIGGTSGVRKKQHVWILCDLEDSFSAAAQVEVVLYSVNSQITARMTPWLDEIEAIKPPSSEPHKVALPPSPI